MQSVIYADVLFFINTVITFLILITTADILKINSSKSRFVSGSFLGGVFSFIIFAPPMNFLLILIIRIIISFLIILITFGLNNLRRFLKCVSGFFLISFLYAGVVYFLSSYFSFTGIYWNNGFTYFDFGAVSLIIITVTLFFCIHIINKKILSKQKDDLLFEVSIYRNEKNITVRALYDTGNNVKDIYCGRPVIIVSITSLDKILDEDEIIRLKKFFRNSTYCDLPAGIRLLPVKTIDSKKLLPAFSADKAVICNNENSFVAEKVCVAVTEDTFGDNNYKALINDSVLGKVF